MSYCTKCENKLSKERNYTMKKLRIILLCLFMMCAFSNVMADENVEVYIDGKLINFDVQPVVINGRTLVPMRKLFEELGATVEWDNDRNTAFAYSKGIYVKMPVGENYYMIDEIYFTSDVPAQEINGRTLVPLRVISEAFGMDVDYNETEGRVNLSSTGKIGRYDYDRYGEYFYGHLENGLPGKFGEVYDANTNRLRAAGSFDHKLNLIEGIKYSNWHNDVFNGRLFSGYVNIKSPSFSYSGGMYNGYLCGHGVAEYDNGDKYDGNWQNDRQNGQGKYVWANNGDWYTGEWYEGMRHGQGALYFKDYQGYEVAYYDGEWKYGMMDGYGVFVRHNDYRYEGEWKDDLPNGYGKYLSYKDLYEYEGEWKDGYPVDE